MHSDHLLAELNPAQVSAATHDDGPLLILAGAGSGKTKTLTHRIAYLIASHHVAPEQILAVTFTNKAAREMRERLWRLLGNLQPKATAPRAGFSGRSEASEFTSEASGGQSPPRLFMPWMGTFHSICVRLLRIEGENIEIPRNFVIIDEADRLSFIKTAMKELGISEKSYAPRSMAAAISGAKNDGMGPQEYAEHARLPAQQAAAEVYPRYERLRRDAAALDFDDLLLEAVRLLTTVPEIRDKWRARFHYIMIDEYQDTNTVQYKLIKLLVNEQQNLCVVGDDWQCLPPGTPIRTPDGERAIDQMKPGDTVEAAAGYGRTAPFAVSEVKKFAYSGELIKITLASGTQLSCTPNHLLFSRWDRTDSYFVYLMHTRDKGFRIGMAKGTRFDGKKDDIGLRVRANQERADRMWILKVCPKRADAQYHEAFFSYSYGIPMMVFHAYANRKMAMTQTHIDTLYAQIDTEIRGRRLLSELGLAFEYPHFVPGATTRGARRHMTANVVLFGDKRTTLTSPWSASRLSVNTTDPSDLKGFTAQGYAVRSGKRGTVRCEIHNLDYGVIEHTLEALRPSLPDNTTIKKYAFLTDVQFAFTPAAHLHPGMLVPVRRDGVVVAEQITSVEKVSYDGPVYDLDIDKVHNYIAADIVVHNSIYSWRGADFTNILNFERDFPGATIVKLEQNYRSTQAILDAAHQVITKNKQRSDKALWTDKSGGQPVQVVHVSSELHEAEAVVTRIRSNVDLKLRAYDDYAVLYRTNAQSRAIEEAFIRYGIPYRLVGGTRFYDRKEIKDLMAYLRLLYQPSDRASFLRIANVPTRGLGPTSVEKFLIWREQTNMTIVDALGAADLCSVVTPRARAALKELGELLARIREHMDELELAELIEKLIERTGYLKYLDDGTPQAEDRQENVRELVSDARERVGLDLANYLEEVALISDLDTAESKDSAVTLMTLHAAKGLEFPCVFMIGMEESIFPHSRALYDASEMEEERRLCYVGMTRAREELYLITASSRLIFGQRMYNVPSRFLGEIDATDVAPAIEMQAGFSAEPQVVLDDDLDLAIGDKVRHQLFGIGTIVGIEGMTIAIAFQGKGIKKLNSAFAPLERI